MSNKYVEGLTNPCTVNLQDAGKLIFEVFHTKKPSGNTFLQQPDSVPGFDVFMSPD